VRSVSLPGQFGAEPPSCFFIAMTDVDDINDAIVANASGPRRVQVGSEIVEQPPIDDQIKARNDAAAQSATSKAHLGLRFTQLVPPGGGGT